MGFLDYLQAWKQLKQQIVEKRAKDLAYKQLLGTELNYMIIQDLVNTARHDVKIDVLTEKGARLTITRVDPFDKLQRKTQSELY